MKQWVYRFGAGEVPQTHAQGSELLGGKGASLAEMSSLGIPVPPGF
ncbi:MAG: PEP/pyruvate-binding domain-containing protein, partial [Alphaproteobacteria bacterium]|nr:PEP/pyruvate-binding domain-containing protein [Alphaproteobacteria bacterium]